MRSSGCRRPASAGRICGRTAASGPVDGPTADGARVRRHRRGGRPAGDRDPTRPIRGRIVLRLGQHLRDLPGGLPDLLRQPRDPRHRRRRAGPADARPAGRRHPGRHPEVPPDDLVPDFLAASDVLGTGWFAAVAAEAGPGKTVAVVGDGAVGLLRGTGRPAARRRADRRHEPPRIPPATGARVRRHRHRHRARRRRRGANQGPHQRARRALGDRGRRHPGVDDAGHRVHPARRPHRLRRRQPRRHAARRRTVHVARASARRPRPGAPLPARADGPHLGPEDQPRQGVRPRAAPRPRPPTATAPWTPAKRSRCCCVPEHRNHNDTKDMPDR